MTDMVAKAPVDQHLARIVEPTIEGMGFRLAESAASRARSIFFLT